jgi:hypothetical protein
LSDGEAEEPLLPDEDGPIWHRLDDKGHMRLVEYYLREAGYLGNVHGFDRSPRRYSFLYTLAASNRSGSESAGTNTRDRKGVFAEWKSDAYSALQRGCIVSQAN